MELTEDILNMEVNDLEEIRAKSDDSKRLTLFLKTLMLLRSQPSKKALQVSRVKKY